MIDESTTPINVVSHTSYITRYIPYAILAVVLSIAGILIYLLMIMLIRNKKQRVTMDNLIDTLHQEALLANAAKQKPPNNAV